jgi:hypothetical protein
MLMSFFILSGLFIVLVAVLVNCAKEVVQSREALAEQRALLQQMMTSLTKTQGRGARSIARRSQSYRQILRDVPGGEGETLDIECHHGGCGIQHIDTCSASKAAAVGSDRIPPMAIVRRNPRRSCRQ